MKNQTSRQAKKGVATIEFALVFSLLFFVFWGIVSYTFPLLVLQTMNRAVSEATRVAAEVNPLQTEFVTIATAAASAELTQQIAWLPAGWRTPITQSVTFEANPQCSLARPNCLLVVQLTYPNYLTNPIVPIITLPGLGPVPRVPNNLTARATLLL